MRALAALMTIVLLMSAAHAQGMGRGKKHQRGAQKMEDKTKIKADETAYQAALKREPVSSIKIDPWANMR